MDKNIIEKQMQDAMEHLDYEFAKIRTGRANPSMLDQVKVEAYGSLVPLNQVALVNIPEATQLLIKPFDPSLLKEIEQGISKTDLDVNPINDGEVIRINIPSLTEDTRKIYVKDAKKKLEEAKIALRNIRKDANNKIKKDEELTEDQQKTLEGEVQKLIDKYNKISEDKLVLKEKDIMTI